MKYPTRFQQKTMWSAVSGVSMLILGSLIVGLIWLIGQIFGFLQPVLVPLLVAGIIAYLLDPVVRLLQNRGMSRLWSVVTVFLGILIAVTLLVAAVLPAVQGGKNFFQKKFSKSPTVLLESTGQDAVSASEEDAPEAELEASEQKKAEAALAPALARSIYKIRSENETGPIGWLLTEVDVDAEGNSGEPIAYANGTPIPDNLEFFWRTRAGRMLTKYQDEILQAGRNFLTAGSTKIFGFIGLILGMIMVPIYLFFFLKDSVSIREHWHEYVPLRASRFKTELVGTLQEINGYLISFFRGQVVVGVIDGFLVGIALFFFDLPYALLIGIFMAILGVIPYIGNILCLIPACIIAYLHAETGNAPFDLNPWPYVGFVVLIFAGVQQINSLFTAPKIVGDSVGLHPLTVIFSMLFWTLILGGFVGALLAVPLTAAVKVIFRRYFWDRTMRDQAKDPYYT